ncbi:MAG: dinitrogenase iron-molybdenum cofactor biosynthesis protein [bacterium]|nr:dinitrogenase iron-molybdenum cofactor biosynthesis protein [bacterium]
MKIAIPTRDNLVDGHFGHCEEFTIFSVSENRKVEEVERLAPPAECGCKSNIIPQLVEKGVKVMLAGNMGPGAVNKLQNSGIEVVRGCVGDISVVAGQWVEGRLMDSGEGCSSHDHECSH